jgi:hypothetical protein
VKATFVPGHVDIGPSSIDIRDWACEGANASELRDFALVWAFRRLNQNHDFHHLLVGMMASALVALEEAGKDPACIADECEHTFENPCPEAVIGCGDAVALVDGLFA